MIGLISKEQIAKKAFTYEINGKKFPKVVFLSDIDKANEVDVAPIVYGHWVTNIYDRDFVRIDKDGFPEKSCYCSVCGDWLTASDEYAVRGYYCPNCGAKMY